MKIKKGYLLREVTGNFFVVPIATREIDFSSLSTLNQTAAFLWGRCENEASKEELVEALLERFDVDAETAAKGVEDFVHAAREAGFLEE